MKNRGLHLRRKRLESAQKGVGASRLGWILVVAVFIGVAALLLLGSANAMGTRSAPDFVKNASVGNNFEVEAGKLALEKSQDDNIRNFAQEMVNDHSAAGENLAAAAEEADVARPDGNLDSKHRKLLNRLREKEGTDFDKAYIHSQVKAHNEAVSLFKSYAHHGDNDAIKKFAADTLPTLEKHKEKIDQMNATYSSH